MCFGDADILPPYDLPRPDNPSLSEGSFLRKEDLRSLEDARRFLFCQEDLFCPRGAFHWWQGSSFKGKGRGPSGSIGFQKANRSLNGRIILLRCGPCLGRTDSYTSALETVEGYIRNQDEHHRKVTFQDEFRVFLRKHKVAWDERYVWE